MRLLRIEDLAVLMDISVSHARQNVVTHPAFPKPILLPGGRRQPTKRWEEDEVIEFLRKLKQPASQPARRPRG